MGKRHFPNLDQLDVQLMRELESDAMQTYKDLASRLNVSRPTIMNRMHQLLDSGIIRIICLADPQALGYKFIVSFAIQAQPGQTASVAERLEACPQILHIYLCTGHFNIIAWALFRENEDLSDFLLNELDSIAGIKDVETILTLQEIKVSPRLLTDDKEPRHLGSPVRELDDLDLALIRELQTNGRQKAGHLAQKLGIYRTTVLRRTKRLLDERAIQIRTIVHPFALGYEGVATIGLKCNPDRVREVAAAVASYKQVQYVSVCTGRYDITIWVVFRKLSDLRKFITVDLGTIAGLKDTETMINHKQVKSVDRLPM